MVFIKEVMAEPVYPQSPMELCSWLGWLKTRRSTALPPGHHKPISTCWNPNSRSPSCTTWTWWWPAGTPPQSSVATWARLRHLSIKKERVEQDEAQLFSYPLWWQGVTGHLNLRISREKYRRVSLDYILCECVCVREDLCPSCNTSTLYETAQIMTGMSVCPVTGRWWKCVFMVHDLNADLKFKALCIDTKARRC